MRKDAVQPYHSWGSANSKNPWIGFVDKSRHGGIRYYRRVKGKYIAGGISSKLITRAYIRRMRKRARCKMPPSNSRFFRRYWV